MPDLSSTDVPVLRARVHRRFSAEECAQIPLGALRFRPLEQADLDEMVALHTEWFPVTYDENFYQRSVRGDLITMVATYNGLPDCGGAAASSSSSSGGAPAASPGAAACGAHGTSAGVGAGQEDIFGMITISTSCEHHADDIMSVLGGECSELCHRKARRTHELGQVAGDAGGSLAYVLTLGVVDGFRRRGLAKALLHNSMEHVNKNMPHVKAVYLHVVTYNEFQMFIHTRNKSACPRPCGLNTSKLVAPGNQDECRTASEGDSCYESVAWAMHDGISMHPEWYPGLSKTSTFEEFQAVVHRLRPASCALPCKCHTAQKGDACYAGIQEETDGRMDPKSRFQAQLKLHRAGTKECEHPCKEVRPRGSPSLFCFSVVSRFNPVEMQLIEAQRSLRASIFDCDESAVLSTEPVSMGDDVTVLTFPEAAVGISNAGTAANAEIFMNAWEAIKKNGRWASYDWIVKTDPDAVLLPPRLRLHLALHHGEEGVYVQNCDRYGGPSLFGALEAFSHSAIQKFFDSGTECRDHLSWQEWGEDVFMALCLDHIGVSSVFDEKLIGDARCYFSDCGDGTSASYHPFKSVSDWTNCWHGAAGGQ